MKKALLFIIALLMLSTLLVSCSDEEEAPDGLQIIEISEEYGFKFYGPESWIVINSSIDKNRQIWGAKMSSANNISITLAKSRMPDKDITAYFNDSIGEFPENMTPTVITLPTKANFGNAKEAYQCVYTYKYEGYSFACLQYLIKNGDDFYIFTYTSYGDVNDEESDYCVYLKDVQTAIDNFLFTDKKEVSDTQGDYEYDADGYRLVCDKKLSGFDLYLPEGAQVINSGAYVSARIGEDGSIYIGKATSTGIQINQYWSNRKAELERVATEVTEIEVNRINNAQADYKVVLGDLPENRVASYEYTYVMDGVKYHVYQVMGVDTFNGYVFTYTAPEEEYSKNIEAVNGILARIKF